MLNESDHEKTHFSWGHYYPNRLVESFFLLVASCYNHIEIAVYRNVL